MADDAYTIAAKCSLDYLKTVLKIASDKPQATEQPCILCGSSDALEFGPDRFRNGQYFFKCYSCTVTGDVIKAIKVSTGWEWKDVFKKVRDDFKGRVSESDHDAYHKKQAAERNGTQLALPPPAEIRQEKPDPVLDMERAEKVITDAHEYLLHDYDNISKKWQRGISEGVAKKYRLGFLEHESIQFYPWSKPMSIPAAWVIPVTDAEGVLKGVKLHFEERPMWGDKECPKLLWYPLGTLPEYKREKENGNWVVKSKPIHAYFSMWPHPETLRQTIHSDFSLDPEYWIQRIPDVIRGEWNDAVEAQKVMLGYELGKADNELEGTELWTAQLRAFDEMKQKIFKLVLKKVDVIEKKKKSEWDSTIFICPGELKALSVESAGLMATAPTNGESWMPGSKLLNCFSRKNICLFGDNDPPRRVFERDSEVVKKVVLTGQEWVNKWTTALRMHGALRVSSKLGGIKERSK